MLVEDCLERTLPATRLLIPILGGIHKIREKIVVPSVEPEKARQEVNSAPEIPLKVEEANTLSSDISHLKPVIHSTTLEIPQIDHDPAAIFQLDMGVKADID